MKVAAIVCIATFNLVVYGSDDSECDSMRCSFVYDPVCGATTGQGVTVVSEFNNLCQLYKTNCFISDSHVVERVPDRFCGIRKPRQKFKSGRRVHDFGITGAAQECNHTCPTSCTDAYQPVCARIYQPDTNKRKFITRTMINHCHVDLFSCSYARNVSIILMRFCFKNSHTLQFMTHVAAMKSLGLFYE